MRHGVRIIISGTLISRWTMISAGFIITSRYSTDSLSYEANSSALPAFNPAQKGTKMALITDIVTIGTAIGTVFFTFWMVKQLFSDKS